MSRRERRLARASGAARDSALVVPAPPPPQGPVPSDVERFGFRFAAREKAVIDFLDAIDAMSPYACVSGLSMEKTGEDVVFAGEDSEKDARRGKDGEEAAAPAPDPRGGPPKPPPRASRMVSGPLREAPVLATVFVDVRFVGAAPMGSRQEEE